MTITVLSMVFAIASVIPIIGPSFGAYALGKNKDRYKRYGFSKLQAIASMAIGELIFFIIGSLIIRAFIEFYKPGVFWYLIVISFILNYSFSLFFYFWGNYKVNNKRKKVTIT